MSLDIVVAGAGPAGAVAAVVLARAGVRVRLLDRARFPRHKLCGDSINPGALDILRRLGLDGVAAGGLRVHGMLVTGEPSVAVLGRYPHGTWGLTLPRITLDERLVRAAVAAGAELDDGVVVRGPIMDRTSTVCGVETVSPAGRVERISARVVIAADGHASRLARAAGLSSFPHAPRRWAVGARFEGVEGHGPFGEMHVRGGRYIGVAPLPDGTTNVCLVTADRTMLRTRDAVREALDLDDRLRDRFARARPVGDPIVLGPLAVESRAAGVPGLLLAGDAAGFIDPMTGDGLRFAFRGAELAAREALRALEGGWNEAHRRLWCARRAEFAVKWRFNRSLRALVGRPGAVRLAAAAARVAPGMMARAIRYAGDVP